MRLLRHFIPRKDKQKDVKFKEKGNYILKEGGGFGRGEGKEVGIG